MKLNKLFYALLALPLVFAACKKSTDAPKQESDYLFDVEMATAERVKEIPEEGIAFEDNQFMIVLQDATENYMLSILIQGEEGETVLSAGTYTSARGALVLQGTFMATADETIYQFDGGEGSVTVTGSVESGYGIEANITDANANKFHFTYNGEIANMCSDVVALDGAQRHDPQDLGENLPDYYYAILFHGQNYGVQCGLTLIGAEGENILTAGTYTIENGGIFEPGCDLILYDNEYSFEGGSIEVVVGGDINGYTFDIQLADKQGNTFHYAYEGKVDSMDPAGEAYPFFYGIYKGNEKSAESYCYRLVLTEKEMINGFPQVDTFTYLFEIYSDVEGVVDAEGYITIPNGAYTIGSNGAFTPGTFDATESYKLKTLEVTDAGIRATKEFFQSGEVTVTDEGVEIDVITNEGARRHIRYDGAPRFLD